MSVNRRHIDASPDEVFAVLADARSYEHWVVGCADIRAVEGDWPAVGSHFHHTIGTGPLKVKDNTKVMAAEPGRRLELEARARPAGVVSVVFELAPAAGGTDVTITEVPVRGLAKRFDKRLPHWLIHHRNAETLRRLDKQVQQRRGPGTG